MPYSLFYNYRHVGDVLFVVLKDLPATGHEHKGEVEVILNGNEAIGYNLFGISKYVKIHNEGLIVLPPDPMVDVINSILINQGLSPLPYVTDSGFHIAEVVSLDPAGDSETLLEAVLDCGTIGRFRTVVKEGSLAIGSLVVIAIKGTRLFDGSSFEGEEIQSVQTDCLLMDYDALSYEGQGTMLLESGCPGEDFFKKS